VLTSNFIILKLKTNNKMSNLTNVNTTTLGDADAYVLPAIGIVVSIISLCLNGLIIFTFIKNRALQSKDGLYFMTLLACNDCFSAFINLLLSIYYICNSMLSFNVTIGKCMPIVSVKLAYLILQFNKLLLFC
jgi:hypothetical protein